MGLSETRWLNSGECTALGYNSYYSGKNSSQHRNGVGIIVPPHVKSAVKSVIYFSDRIMLLQPHAIPIDLNIIQICAPTTDKDKTTIKEFYEQLEQLIKMTNKLKIKIIMADFNAKLGKGKEKMQLEALDWEREMTVETVLLASVKNKR